MKITLRKEPQLPYAIPVDEVTSPKKKKNGAAYTYPSRDQWNLLSLRLRMCVIPRFTNINTTVSFIPGEIYFASSIIWGELLKC